MSLRGCPFFVLISDTFPAQTIFLSFQAGKEFVYAEYYCYFCVLKTYIINNGRTSY